VDAEGRQQLIEELCSVRGRGPGTDAERRAANLLAARLRRHPRRAGTEPAFVHPQWALVHALNATVAIAGSLVATRAPALGFALVLAAATSTYLDLSTRLYLTRRIFFRRASQNVVSPGPRPEAPVRLVLAAHYDAGRTGYVFGARFRRLAARLSPRARVLLGPFRIMLWGSMVPLLAIVGARMAGLDAGWLSVIQLLPTVLLIVAVFLLVDVALSGLSPGACDNASGVAAVLSAAEQLDRELPANLDVWVLLTGGQECTSEGMRGWIRRNREQLDRERTLIVNVESVSFGSPHFLLSEGAAISHPSDPELIDLCGALADADREGENRYRTGPARLPIVTDAVPASVRGLRAISLIGLTDGLPAPWRHTEDDLPARVDGRALTRATELLVGLARLLDRGLERQPPAGAATRPGAGAPVA
jgi:hypothetical protein